MQSVSRDAMAVATRTAAADQVDQLLFDMRERHWRDVNDTESFGRASDSVMQDWDVSEMAPEMDVRGRAPAVGPTSSASTSPGKWDTHIIGSTSSSSSDAYARRLSTAVADITDTNGFMDMGKPRSRFDMDRASQVAQTRPAMTAAGGGWRDVASTSGGGGSGGGSMHHGRGGKTGAPMCRYTEYAEVIALRDFAVNKTLELSVESANRFFEELFSKLLNVLNSSESTAKYTVSMAVIALIPVKITEEATKIQRLANLLREIIQTSGSCDIVTLHAAASALGFLVHVGGALTADIVEGEVSRALEWMSAVERVETRRLMAALILEEMASNAPTIFNVHVGEFISRIFHGLRDSVTTIRHRSVLALRACLLVIEARETRKRVMWYYTLFDQTQQGMSKGCSIDSIHGSLLTIGELLRHTGEFMLARYREVAEGVLRFRDSKDRMIRMTVALLLPRVAAFSPDRFTTSYLQTTMTFLFALCKSPQERPMALVAIGRLAMALASTGGMRQYFSAIASQIRDVLSRAKKNQSGVNESLECVGALSAAAGPLWRPHCEFLLDSIFSNERELREPLVQALSRMSLALPPAQIHSRILDKVCLVLAKKKFTEISGVPQLTAATLIPSSAPSKEPSTPAVVTTASSSSQRRIALSTLSRVNFDISYGPYLLELTQKVLLGYLSDSDGAIRCEAALTCCSILERYGMCGMSSGSEDPSFPITHGRVVIADIFERILIVAVADEEADVRREVLRALLRPVPIFDDFLAQGELLRSLFMTLNDEDNVIRELSTSLCGRLASRNPAYVLPALRRQLMQLLTDLDHAVDGQQRQQSAKMLTCMVRAAPRVIQPYVAPVTKALISKLKEGQISPSPNLYGGVIGMGSGVHIQKDILECVGYTTKVGGATIEPFLPEILPLVIESLRDSSAAGKREVATVALGKVVLYTGSVITPYHSYPNLLSILLRLLTENSLLSRCEVIRTIGIIGALDPHAHKKAQALAIDISNATSRSELGHEAIVVVQAHPSPALGLDDQDLPSMSSGMGTSSEDYYPNIAIRTLMRILRDNTLSSHHLTVVRSLIFIFQAQGLACVQYLPRVMPVLFHVLRTGEESLRELIFQQFTKLVSISKNYIRKYLSELMMLVHEYWTTPSLLLPILKLLEHLSIVLQDEFRMYVPPLLPRMIGFLVEAERSCDWATAMAVLHALEIVAMHAESSLHMLIPTLARLITPKGSINKDLQKAALRSLSNLIPRIQIANHASMVVHALRRMIESGPVELREAAVGVLCAVAQTMGTDFQTFVPMTESLLSRNNISHRGLEATLVKIVLRRRSEIDHDPLATALPSSSSRRRSESLSDGDSMVLPGIKLHVNQNVLKQAWDSGQRSTKEDWTEWMRHLSVELLKESPSPALRACCSIAQVQPNVARELFPAGFLSCWSELVEGYQDQLVRSLEAAFASPTIPPEIIATLLNLAEFMEHDEKPLPVEIRTLGALAEKCHAYAKALYYKEQQFKTEPEACIEKLIHINNQLNLPEAASGMLAYAQKELKLEFKETLYEKLQRWSDALEAYRKKPADLDSQLGVMRCLSHMHEFEELRDVCGQIWQTSSQSVEIRKQVAPIAAEAAWKMGDWDSLSMYTDALSGDSPSSGVGDFYSAILDIHAGQHDAAREHVAQCREALSLELPALVGESYERAYPDMIRVQQLAELEEVIEYSEYDGTIAPDRRVMIRKMWRERLCGAQRSVSVWQQLLSVRQLVVPMQEDPMWEKFANLCLKSGAAKQGMRTLIKLLGYNPCDIPMTEPLPISQNGRPSVLLTYLKHLYASGEQVQAFARLEELTQQLRNGRYSDVALSTEDSYSRVPLLARAFLKLGKWRWALAGGLSDAVVVDVLTSFKAATDVSMGWGKAWHTWALFNISSMEYYNDIAKNPQAAARHVGPAVTGFFRSIALAAGRQDGASECLQDILRLLTLWFAHGTQADVEIAVKEGLSQISIQTWLSVIPQLIARIHTPSLPVRNLLHQLLVRIGKEYPQMLIYPLLVACQSQSTVRRAAAENILDAMRQHSARLVDEAHLVSKEFIRVAILWHEQWHEALEEASRLYFGEHDVDSMLACLAPLHTKLEQSGPETLNETSFLQSYGRELAEAVEWCRKYQITRNMADLNQAWDLYYQVFKKINKQLPSLTTLELSYVSPALVDVNGIQLAIPGTHAVGDNVITIASFAPQLQVISSKQRPRKLTIVGSNGLEYSYLLKGHEDLRQDERVMQLFGLVNSLLSNDRTTEERNLSIQRYAVIPLSPNSGLISWVPGCDTLHSLIREYRENKKIALNLEHRIIMNMSPEYDQLPLINKVEVFQHSLESTHGTDLQKILWIKSRNSEVWLDRRTNFTRSLAVMSMVGYVLGLGDRHPSNIMVDRNSGKILHIDFGDCFEASMNREKYPEKVPFRLTRMLVKAMEVCGTEGTFKFTCEKVLHVLRTNKDSVMAMLEAFVHDPLINWRLIASAHGNVDPDQADPVASETQASGDESAAVQSDEAAMTNGGDANGVERVAEELNDRAVTVMKRMGDKLGGRDGAAHDAGQTDTVDDVEEQVERLIQQATSHENLCQAYIGWCPFW